MIWKVLVGLIWLWALAAMLVPGVPLASFGAPVFGIMVVVHALECLVFLPRLRAAGDSLGNHLLQTFLFGMAHVATTPPVTPSGS